MAKEMLINVSAGEECRIALVDGGRLEELYMERTSSTSHVGNIYKGRVTNVEPSIQAAFVDFGLGRNGFLHISDLMPTYFGRKGEEITEAVGRKMARRDRPPIQRCLRRGDEIVVQIIKEGIGTKGPTLSTYVSIPGRMLVMMPGMGKFGISRKIEDEEERKRLRGILDQLKPIDDVGFIIRTAGVGKTKTEIQRDLTYLTRLWSNIQKKMKEPAPVELYTEGDLVTRTVRDVYTSEVDKVVIDNKEVARQVREFFKIAMPRTRSKVELYDDPIPLFHKYGIEREIEQIYSRHVPLPSGGSLVIDQTEAIVAIDVNSGKFRDHADAETTAFKTDLEAADEIPRQLRLRDLGGVIICDFIDLRFEKHRRELERRLHENMKRDRAKAKILRMSQFGIIEMTRQRMRPSLKRSIYQDCPHCRGAGLVKTPESMSIDVMRKLTLAAHDKRVVRIELGVCTDVAFHLSNRKRAQIAELEKETGKQILVRPERDLALDELKLTLFDARDGLVFVEELGVMPEPSSAPRTRGRGRGDRGRGARVAGGARGRSEAVQSDPGDEEDRYDRDSDLQGSSEDAERASDAGEDDLSEPESSVVDVEDGFEPMGESPRPMEEDDRRGKRRGRSSGHRRSDRDATNDRRHPRTPEVSEPPAQRAESAAESGDGDHDPSESDAQPAGNGDGEEKPRKRRRRRGGRRHRARRERQRALEAAQAGSNEMTSTPESGEGAPDADDSPSETPTPPTPEPASSNIYYDEYEEPGDSIGNRIDLPPPTADRYKQSQKRGGRGGHSSGQHARGNARHGSKGQRAQPRRNDQHSGRRPHPSNQATSPQRTPPVREPQPAPKKVISLPPVVKTGSTDRHLADDLPVLHEPLPRPRSRRDLDALPDFDDE
jgi:ribonuclease E